MPRNQNIVLNTRVLDQIRNNLNTFDNKYIVVGLLGTAGSEIVMRGVYTEFGTSKMPAWRWLKRSVDRMTPTYKNYAFTLIRNILNNRPPNYDIIGLWAKSQVQTFLAEVRTPRLSWATIQKKKSDKPLIDTGQMRMSISYEVRG
jgi:hypothetical protein